MKVNKKLLQQHLTVTSNKQSEWHSTSDGNDLTALATREKLKV